MYRRVGCETLDRDNYQRNKDMTDAPQNTYNHFESQPIPYSVIKQRRSGVNIIEAFLLLFVAFKLAHIIAWSWIIVLAPAWLPIVAAASMAMFGKTVRSLIEKRMRNRW
jgi:hypothetical protein